MAKVVGPCSMAMPVIASLIFVAIVFVSTPASAVLPDCDSDSGVDFQMSTDRRVYVPGALMRVRFTVTNNSESPLYFIRRLSTCSSQLGQYSLSIFDHKNRDNRNSGCSVDSLMDQLDAVEMLTDPNETIILRQGEIHGHEESIDAPVKPGTYRLEAVLFPPGFNPKQQQILSQKHMRILECRVPAPVITIMVK
jgi:hypothetical protein